MAIGMVTTSVSLSLYLNMTIALTRATVQLKKTRVSYMEAIGAWPVEYILSKRPAVWTMRPATRSHLDALPAAFAPDAWWIITEIRPRE